MEERVLCVDLLIELGMGFIIVTSRFDQRMIGRFSQTVIYFIWLLG